MKWSLDKDCSPSQLMKNFCLKKTREEREKSKKAKEKYRPAVAAEREAVWVDASVLLWVEIHIHSKRSIYIGLSMPSSRGIIVTVSVRAGLDLQCCSQGSTFFTHFSHLCFYVVFIPRAVYCVGIFAFSIRLCWMGKPLGEMYGEQCCQAQSRRAEHLICHGHVVFAVS